MKNGRINIVTDMKWANAFGNKETDLIDMGCHKTSICKIYKGFEVQ